MAAVVVAVPTVLVKTARYRLPDSAAVAAKLRAVEVAPERLPYEVPPLVLTCHCTPGVGVPLAAAVKLAELPAVTVWLLGFWVTLGAASTSMSI